MLIIVGMASEIMSGPTGASVMRAWCSAEFLLGATNSFMIDRTSLFPLAARLSGK